MKMKIKNALYRVGLRIYNRFGDMEMWIKYHH